MYGIQYTIHIFTTLKTNTQKIQVFQPKILTHNNSPPHILNHNLRTVRQPRYTTLVRHIL